MAPGALLPSPARRHRANLPLDARTTQLETGVNAEPFNTIVRAFTNFDVDLTQLQPMAQYLERVILPATQVLWRQGDQPDGLYLIESGILRASYNFTEFTQSIEESMVPGTLAGELSALSGLSRNTTTVAERQSVVWRLSMENLERLHVEKPELARMFVGLVVKGGPSLHLHIFFCS